MSRTNLPILTETFVAAATITANRFISGDRQAATITGAGLTANGVSQSEAGTGEYFPVVTMGVVNVICAAAIAANALIESDATGKAVTKNAGITLGRARNATTAANQPVEVFLLIPSV